MKKTFKKVIDCFMTGADVSTLTEKIIKTVVNNFREFWDYFDENYLNSNGIEDDDTLNALDKIQEYFLRLALEGKAPVDVLWMFEDRNPCELLATLEAIIIEKQPTE